MYGGICPTLVFILLSLPLLSTEHVEILEKCNWNVDQAATTLLDTAAVSTFLEAFKSNQTPLTSGKCVERT